MTCPTCDPVKEAAAKECADMAELADLQELNARASFYRQCEKAIDNLDLAPLLEQDKGAAPVPEEPSLCTCHPDDNPPRPCPKKHAYSECMRAALSASEEARKRAELEVSRLVSANEHWHVRVTQEKSLREQAEAKLTASEERYGRALDDALRKSNMYNDAIERAEQAEAKLARAYEGVIAWSSPGDKNMIQRYEILSEAKKHADLIGGGE